MKLATRPDELISRDDVMRYTGLEQLERILAGDIAAPPIAGPMMYHLHAVAPGRVAFRGAPTFDMCNPAGTVHGGWYGTLLDSAMTCAVMSEVPRGAVQTTLEYKVNIVRPIPLGCEVEAVGTTQHVGRSTGVAVGEIRGVADGRLYATGSTTCMIMQI